MFGLQTPSPQGLQVAESGSRRPNFFGKLAAFLILSHLARVARVTNLLVGGRGGAVFFLTVESESPGVRTRWHGLDEVEDQQPGQGRH